MEQGTASPRRYCEVRSLTEQIAAPLSAEDQTAQSMPDVSPTKWHRAHTTWFFEEFLLSGTSGYQPIEPGYRFLFNSYYEGVGPRHPRAERGAVTRPGIAEVAAYRAHVDAAMLARLEDGTDDATAALVELGLHHEQQHQELALMDIKHVLSRNVLDPEYRPSTPTSDRSSEPAAVRWHEHSGGVLPIGCDGAGFSFDNELPAHDACLRPFAVASRPISDGDVLAFIADDGYRRPDLWLSDGWATVQAQGWEAPLYWRHDDDGWTQFTLAGRRPVHPADTTCHLSYYEADAIARWADARLPTEAEWEVVAREQPIAGNLLDLDVLHPTAAPDDPSAPQQLYGDVWEWTSSAYLPYPGFRAAPGAVGEYNGKFMVNQQVLRGGCCATPVGHVRPTYRNFFPPSARWAFSGARLARDLEV